MYGLVDIQRSLNDSANQGLQHASDMERSREMAGDELRAADKGRMMSSIGTGAGVGFMVGGPAGAVAGAGVGYLTYKFL